MTDNETPIGRSTGITIGVLALLASSFVGSALWIGGRFDELRDEIIELRFTTGNMARDVEAIRALANGSLRRSEFEAWVSVFRAKNGDLDIPEPPDGH